MEREDTGTCGWGEGTPREGRGRSTAGSGIGAERSAALRDEARPWVGT